MSVLRQPASTMIRSFFKSFTRHQSTTTGAYPFSSTAVVAAPATIAPTTDGLRQGRGLMAHIHQTLPPADKQHLLKTLFSRRNPRRVLPGSILTVTLEHAPTVFTGVLIAVRRRGPDTSFVLRNVVQRTGVEVQFFVGSPHLKEVRVDKRASGRKADFKARKGGITAAGEGAGAAGREGAQAKSSQQENMRQRRAKLYFLRNDPGKMTAIAAGSGMR
jgi:large subunit ribosomal protein L19